MKKVTFGLSLIVIVSCSVGMWKLNSLVNINEKNFDAISQSEKVLEKMNASIVEFANEHAARFSRERRKNQEMEAKLLEQSTEKSKYENLLADKNSQIESLKKGKEETAQEIVDLKVELRRVANKTNEVKNDASRVQLEIPQIEAKILNIQNQCNEQINRSETISNSLSDYALITKALKEHFDRTLDSLFQDKYERPWIEQGEMIRLSSFSLDLDRGLLGLPVGQEIGLEVGAFLSISRNQELICKIRIKEAEQRKSIAFIMPLFGDPKKLMEIDHFELKHL